MSSYENLQTALFSTENAEFEEPCVKYSSKTMGKARYMKAEDFNKHIKTYIRSNLKSKRFLTDKNNNINIHKAMNAFYIDLDFKMTIKKTSKQIKLNDALLDVFLEAFKVVSGEKKINDYYFFPFTANEFTTDDGEKTFKGGSHTMIICKRNFSKDERKDVYDKMIDYVVKHFNEFSIKLDRIDGYKEDINLNDFFMGILDYAPINSGNLLMPFAQKSPESRQYALRTEKMFYKNQDWFALDIDHKQSITDENISGKTSFDDMMNTTSEDILPEPSHVLSREAKLIFDFVSSFKYLSKSHPIWEKLFSDHNEYYYSFVKPYYKMLVLLNIFSAPNMKMLNRYINKVNGTRKSCDIFTMIGKLVAKQMASLCSQRNDYTKGKNRCVYVEQYKNIHSMIIIPFKNELNDTRPFDELYEENSFEEDEDEGKEANKVNISSFNTYLKMYYFLKMYELNPSRKNRNYMKAISNDVMIQVVNSNMWNKFNAKCKTILNEFIKEIIYKFKNGISDEIEPFDSTRSYTKQMCYRNETSSFKEPLTFYDVDPTFAIGCDGNAKKGRDETYTKTIKLWITVLLTFMLYDVDFQLQEAIKHTLGPFIKKYIVIIPTQSAGNNRTHVGEKVLVYNIRQTIELEKYPYNQWIGNATNMIQKWLNKLYDNYIAKALRTIEKDTGVKLIIDILNDNKLITTPTALRTIKPLAHADKDITEMQRNIISFHNTESSVIPENILIETSNIFPMRNGWLFFDKNGDIEFRTNNREKFLGSGTNVPWVGDLSEYKKYIKENEKARKAYEDISTMIEQIYPIPEERDYNMKLFSSVLYGIGLKDMLHVMFGTGSDGKTTIMNALFSMLDAQGFTSDVHAEENGRIIEVIAIRGLAETMNADTLLVSNKPGSHDEGGRACIAHMRLVSVQEPDQNLNGGCLNGAVIKELTSGGAISARKIYGEAESVQANALIAFQTNTCPGTDDTSYGFRRRLSLYTHRAKFYPASEMVNRHTKYKYEAKPALGEAVKHDLYYKQAMFYYLLPYAVDNLKNEHYSLQSIPKPEIIKNGIDQIINHSTGVSKWLADYIVEYEEDKHATSGIINVASLIEVMTTMNRNQDGKFWGRQRTTNKEVNMIINALQNNFESQIYRLKGKYYRKTKSGYKVDYSSHKGLEDFADNLCNPLYKIKGKKTPYKELAETYLKKTATNNTNDARTQKYEDLYIVGYAYTSNIKQMDEIEDEL